MTARSGRTERGVVLAGVKAKPPPGLGLRPALTPAAGDTLTTGSEQTETTRIQQLHVSTEPGDCRYTLTPDGVKVAVFYTKIHDRLLRPLVAAADQPPAPTELRRALHTINRVINDYADHARLTPAA
jgi:hypothetical protein